MLLFRFNSGRVCSKLYNDKAVGTWMIQLYVVLSKKVIFTEYNISRRSSFRSIYLRPLQICQCIKSQRRIPVGDNKGEVVVSIHLNGFLYTVVGYKFDV